jgi:DNA invertase Pin-like site-specific DNA recombinase
MHVEAIKYGYARVPTVGQSVDAQVRQLANAGCRKVFRETVKRGRSTAPSTARR